MLLPFLERPARWLFMAWFVILQSRLRRRYGDTVVVSVLGVRLSLDLRERHDVRMFWSIVRQGSYEPETSQLLSRLLRPGDTFVDVGANNGYFALLAGQFVGAAGRVIAIEPNPRAVERLRRNVELNGLGTTVQVRPIALGGAEGEQRLYISRFEDGWASLLPFAGARRSVPVRVSTLDHELASADGIVMKLDAEGSEMQILRGMSRYLEHAQDVAMILEWNHLFGSRSLWEYLRERFRVYRIVGASDRRSVHLQEVRGWNEVRGAYLMNLFVTSGPRWESRISEE